MSDLAMRLADVARENEVPIYTIYAYEKGIISHAEVNPSHVVNNIYSVSKSFTSVAIGMLCDRNILKMTDTVYDCIKDVAPYCPEVWKKVTLDMLIGQRSGVYHMFLDIDTDDISEYGTDDFLRYVLEHPMDAEPGSGFGYSDSNFYLASRIVSAKTGKFLHDFMREEMFTPMGFQAWSWAVCPHGYSAGGTGLTINCRDMLKFGMMLLGKGVYNGRRYVSEEWLANAVSAHSNVNHNTDYGWGIWLPTESDAFMCTGAYGQMIFVDPKNDRAVAWQTYDPKSRNGALLVMLREEAK